MGGLSQSKITLEQEQHRVRGDTMLPDIGRNGDVLERGSADFIRQRLPEYNRLWSRYIGNDGRAQLPFEDALSPNLQAKRKESAVFTYTALEAILCANEVVADIESRQLGAEKRKVSTSDYLWALNGLVLFYAQIGRVVDALKHLSKLWHDNQLWKPLDEYYQQRNNVLHEASVPCRFEGNGLLLVVEPEGANPDERRWGAHRTWSDANNMVVSALPDLSARVFGTVVQLVNNAYGRLNACHMAEQFAPLVPKMEEHGWTAIEVRPSSSSSIALAWDSLGLPAEGR